MKTADDFFGRFYTQRLLVFLEEEPQSNTYRQVLLSADDYKRVSDAISIEAFKNPAFKEDYEQVMLALSDDIYPLPDLQGIQDINNK